MEFGGGDKVVVNHHGRERSPVCFNRTLYNALPEEILKCFMYIDFMRHLHKYFKDKVFFSLDNLFNKAL